jgi:TetR/AcrR family transcriptional repressor of mexJK operon
MAKKSQLILETAQRLFLERGYTATSLDEVAAAAGVSKTTVYSNFGDKETLFATVVEGITSNAAQILTSLEEALRAEVDLPARLKALASQLLAGILAPEVLQLRRLAMAEAPRFPEIASHFWHNGPARTVELLSGAFRALDEAGELRIGDPVVAATQFTYLVVSDHQDRALMVPTETPDADEVEQRITAAVAIFLSAYGTPAPDLADTVEPR